ncbi:MAG: AAA family ATPase [Rickettsiales bacterium]|nr:AAA family ATPase [Rickettsiales bacterium]
MNDKVTSDLPFMAFVSDVADVDTLKAFASEKGWSQADINQGDIRTATDALKNKPSPQLLMVEIESAKEAPGLLDRLADVCGPDTKVIVVGSINEFTFYNWLMDLGISSYLLKPLTAQAVEGAYNKSLAKPQVEVKSDRPPGKVFSVIGARGGVGSTTVSLNLAGVIANMAPAKNVILVDVDPYDGSIALSLDIDPSRGMREALENPSRIDQLFIDRVVSKPLKNLSILSSEEALADFITVHEDSLSVLLKELKAKFDVIIFDLPRKLEPFHRGCMQQSEQVVLVSELSLVALRDGLRITDMMRESLKIKPPVIVANKVGLAKKIEMQVNDFEKGINGKVEAKIPFVPDVFMPISSEVPAVKKKGHAAIKPLLHLAEFLLPDVKPKDAKSGKKSAFFKK